MLESGTRICPFCGEPATLAASPVVEGLPELVLLNELAPVPATREETLKELRRLESYFGELDTKYATLADLWLKSACWQAPSKTRWAVGGFLLALLLYLLVGIHLPAMAAWIFVVLWGVIAPGALVYLGYPFHPPGKPEATRGAHLAQIAAPQLFVEGTADPFIQPVDEFQAAVGASPDAEIVWIAGGGHSFEVRGARRPADDVGADLVASVLPWLRARFASPSHRASRESPPDPRERDGDSRETG